MFKIGLLTSTAMTAVTLLLSGAPTGAYAQTDMHIASRDPNARFLCTYGQFLVSNSVYSESGFGFYSRWKHVAVPVTGHGQKVRRIRIIEKGRARNGESRVTVGIYSNTPSGFPGALIASGFGNVNSSTCGPISIRIQPTKLKRNNTYWIEENVFSAVSQSSTQMYWTANPDTKRKAYVQIHTHTVCSSRASNCRNSSYTSPWTKQTKGPYLTLK